MFNLILIINTWLTRRVGCFSWTNTTYSKYSKCYPILWVHPKLPNKILIFVLYLLFWSLHVFAVTIHKFYGDVYSSSFFPPTARPWDFWPAHCFLWFTIWVVWKLELIPIYIFCSVYLFFVFYLCNSLLQ